MSQSQKFKSQKLQPKISLTDKAKAKKPAAIFLIVMAILIVIGVSATIIFNFFPWKIMQIALVPGHDFAAKIPTEQADYSQSSGWYARKGEQAESAMIPQGLVEAETDRLSPKVDVFYIHPTTYINANRWNGPIDGAEVTFRTRFYALKNQASAFNLAGQLYAPRYRQATFGAFLVSGSGKEKSAVKALDLAYGDIEVAFKHYLKHDNQGKPFILVGHSQGALHALHLLNKVISGTPYRDQMIAAYVIGWPVGKETDLPALPDIDICRTENDLHCVISWQSFIAEDFGGAPSRFAEIFQTYPSLTGQPRVKGEMLCVNPLNWTIGSSAGRENNLGAVETAETKDPLSAPIPDFIGAACTKDGLLVLSRDPDQKPWINSRLPGKNMHVHDINLFYMNVRRNAAHRGQKFLEQNNTGFEGIPQTGISPKSGISAKYGP